MTMTRSDLLADHFIRATGIAGVCINATDAGISLYAIEAVTLSAPKGCVLLCCARLEDATRIAAAAGAKLSKGVTAAQAGATVRAIAAGVGLGLTPHDIVVARARAAVARVDQILHQMKAAGDLNSINRGFKAAREADPNVGWADYLHARKEGMLTLIAHQLAGERRSERGNGPTNAGPSRRGFGMKHVISRPPATNNRDPNGSFRCSS
jgi:hypothetical protein